jgi:hypothetical protein
MEVDMFMNLRFHNLLYNKGIFKTFFIELVILYYIIGSSPIEMIYFRNMEYNKSMKSGVFSNFYFEWYFLNLVLKGSPLNFFHIQNYFHFYVMYGNRYVYEFWISLFTYTIKGYSRVLFKNK